MRQSTMAQNHHKLKGGLGQSFVELALMLPILLFLLVGFVEVGAVAYNYLSMLDAAFVQLVLFTDLLIFISLPLNIINFKKISNSIQMSAL